MSTRITGLLFLLLAAFTPGGTVGSRTDLEDFDPVALIVSPSRESAGAFDIALTPRVTDSCRVCPAASTRV